MSSPTQTGGKDELNIVSVRK